ncbi:two-partner secretion domain-containing protein [Pseudomonas sp. 210_17 TE3656]
MDVHQFAFLLRQPSAALLSRERFCGLPKRGVALLLANVMFWQPLWALADGLVVSAPGTSVERAGNGVPIVNIAAPNASGLSHNQFRDYNVGSEGVILNNATGRTQATQLGGIILGNPNLGGKAASTILNEVNGGNPSQLRGYTEVAGQSARVIVANPYGISCNGCGFINTPRVTLSTGKPILNNGRLDHFQVDAGSVAIEGAGLNASNVDSFEIITRSARINAEIQANNLSIVAGRNDVDAHSLSATARTKDGSAQPELAIDSSVLGGMYAGTIKLVGTEAGVGVRLAGNLAASAGDIQIDANGHLSLAQAASSNAINVKASSLQAQGPVYAGTTLDVQTLADLSNQQSLAARDRISLSSGGQLSNTGIIEAGVNANNSRNTTGDVSLNAENLRNVGSVLASRNLDMRVTQALDNRGGTLSAQQRTQVATATLDNRQQGQVLSQDSLVLNAGRTLNSQGLINSRGTLTAQIVQLDNNSGEFSSHAAAYLHVTALDNVAGLIMAGQNLSLVASGAVNNRNGRLGANQAMSLSGSTLDNSQNGLVTAVNHLDLNLTHLDNQRGLLRAGSAQLKADTVDNSGGRISSNAELVANLGNLTQQGGELVAQGNLNLTGTTLDNRNAGLIGAGKALTVHVNSIDNRAGELSSAAALNVSAQQLNNSDGGKVLAGTDLGLTVKHIINQTKGLLHGRNSASVLGDTLDNSGGTLSALSALDLRLEGALTNLGGLISSEGGLTLNAASVNNQQGTLSSAGQLGLNSKGGIDNRGGQMVTDADLNLQSASLDNRQGTLSSKGPVRISTGTVDNSHSGRVTSSDTLDLTATQVSNQDKGRIASDKALTVSVTGLDQQNGLLFSATALDLNLNRGQLNNQNGLISAPLLMLRNLNGINNQGGELSSAQAYTLAAASLDNRNGKLLSNQALTLRIDQALNNLKGLIAAAALDVRAASLNNQGGTLTSRDTLDLAVTGLLDNQNQGLINATRRLNIQSGALHNQHGGSLLGDAIALDFGTAGGDLNNNGGLVTTAGPLSISHLRDLSNQGGEISSSQSFALAGRNLDNQAGKLISSQQLTLHGASVLNQNGLISGWKGLAVTAGSLDNRNNGTLSSRNGGLTVEVENTLLNSAAGALVSQQNLTVKAASLDNSAGGILSSAGEQALTVAGELNNSQGGQIDSSTTLSVEATRLNNNGGSISATQALNVSGTTLDNATGRLIGNAGVTLTLLGTLTNTQGKLASAGPLRLSATQVDNQGGQLASQGLLTLLTGGLDNRNRGTVAANDLLTLTATGVVQNAADGLIYSQHGDLRVRAASLNNNQGTLQSQGALKLDVAGDIDNQKGRLLAQDAELTVSAINLDNRGGVLTSLYAALSASLSGWLQNASGGITQGERLNLTALGINNQSGRIAAQTGDVVINSSSFDNRSGGLYAARKIDVTGSDFVNSAGQIAGQQIDLSLAGALNNSSGIVESDSVLNVAANSLNNQSGKLRALGTSGISRFQIGGVLDNRNGSVESANTDLSLLMGGFLNAGGTVLHVGTGTFDIATAHVMNAGGSLVTRGGLSLTADSWTNSSVIQAGRLTVDVAHFIQTASGQLLAAESLTGSGVNWSNDGLIASDGSLNVGLTGLYSGNGRLSSRGDLSLYTGQLQLPEVASIASGGDSTITVAGLLTNYGRLTSTSDLTLNTGSLNNYGTLGSGQDLTLTSSALLNDHGLIFSGRNMGLRVGSLTNSYASIYSLGDLDIDRDGAGGWATSIINSSGLIQSDGSMSLAASTVENIRALLTISNAGIYTARIKEIRCIEGVNAGDCSGKRNRVWEIVQREKLEVTAASAASSITAGGNLDIKGGDLLNHSSTIASSGNFTATLNNLTNTGVEASDTETVRVFRTQRASNGSGWTNAANNFTQRYWFESDGYDASNLSGLAADMSRFIGSTEAELHQFGRVTQLSTGDQTYAAIIQAAGNVNITAQNNFDSSVVRAGYEYVGSGPSTNTTAPDREFSTRVTLNQQLPPELAQQQVNPLALPGFELPSGQNGLFRLSGQGASQGDTGPQSWNLGDASVGSAQRQQEVPGTQGRDTGIKSPGSLGMAGPVSVAKVQGLPSSSGKSSPHKYLIETNPALTDLKQFMSSDYLLGKLGYNPDDSAKRLGDGFYEQYLIQQAVVARTGQRFLEGLTSDEAMFRYLMDNAIASKDALNLSLGVGLSAEQVAALTHDIVWMETLLVDGQEVLVPVLYLAHSNNRLAANGALIQGKDVSLIAGNNLSNAGTLKASDNLTALASNNLINSGLIQAGDRLDLLAGNDLSNKAGGVITGRDVSLTSLTGDVTNERTVTGYDSSNGYNSQHRDFVDNAARIEAANDLTIQAGRDVSNIGGVLQSGRDTSISAGRDVTIGSAAQLNSNSRGSKNRDLTISQNGSNLEAGRDLSISAGRDLAVIASQVDAQRDIALDAGNNLTLASAADEQHSYNKSKKVEAQEDHVSQIATSLNAGGDVKLSAGQDLTLIASKVTAGEEAYLVAGGNLELLAAQDSDYSLYDKKKKGSFGSKKTQRDEVTDVKNIGSEIKTGGDLTLISGGDQKYQAAKLESGKDLSISSGGTVTFEVVKDLHQESHEKSNNNAFWVSSKGKGNTDETLRQTQMVAAGEIAINAVEGLKIDIKQVDQQTVSQSIDAMVKADPQLAWLKQAEARGDVDWRQVKEIHDSFKYSNSGLGPASQIIIAIVMAAVVGPMAAAASAGAGAGVAAGVGAVAASASTNAAVSAVNNRGNLGAVFKDVTSSDAMKGYAISGITAGLTAGYFDNLTGTETNTFIGRITPVSSLSTWSGVGQFAANQTLQSGTSMLLSKALGQGGSASDALKNALFNTLAAASFNAVGDYTKGVVADGSAPKIAIHAMVGGLLAKATGGDFKTGALAAGANEALVVHLDTLVKGNANLLTMSSQIVGVLAAAGQKDADAAQMDKGAWVAANSTQYNYLAHNQLERAARKIAACSDDACIYETTRAYKELSLQQDIEAIASCKADPSACAALSKTVANTMADLDPIKDLADYGSPNAREAVQNLINSNFEFQEMLAAATAEHSVDAMVDSLKAKWNLSDAQAHDITSGLKIAVAAGLGTAAGVLAYKRAVASAKANPAPVSGPKEISKLPVPNDLPTKIHMGQQGKHIKGHNNFEEGRSYFNDGVDPAELLGGVHSGKYPVVGAGARGNPIVDFGRPIGVDGRTGQSVTRGQIHYGKNGAHIVPDARN